MRYQGTIISWKDERGFGFIRPLNGEPDVFVHISSFRDRSRRPSINDRVIYELSFTAKGKYEARNITYWEGYSTEIKRQARPLNLEIVGVAGIAGCTSLQQARGNNIKPPPKIPRNPLPKPLPREVRKPTRAPVQTPKSKPRRGKDPFFETAMALMIFITLESMFFTFLFLNIGAKIIPRFVVMIYLAMSFLTYQTYVQDKNAARAGRWRTREKTLHTLSLLCGWPGALLVQYIERHKVVKTEFQLVFWLTVSVNCFFLLLIFPRSLPYIMQLVGRVF